MSFYDDADSTGIVEDHIQAVLKLSDAHELRFQSQYQEIRNELIDRLSRLPPGSFTAQHVRGVLAQINGAIEAMNKHLSGSTLEAAYEAGVEANKDLIREIRVFDKQFTGAVTPINLDAEMVAQDTANFLVTKFDTNLSAYGNDLMTQITNGLFSAAIGETSMEEVVGRVGQFFVAEQWKLRRIVRTEMMNCSNMAKTNGLIELRDSDQVPDLKKTLFNVMDDRTADDSKYVDSLHLVVPVDEPFRYKWRGEWREFWTSDRPNDRGIVLPYRDAWEE